MRFQFFSGTLIKPLVLPFGVKHTTSWVELSEDKLHICMGLLFNYKLDISKMESASRGKWPLLYGLGVRIGPAKKFGVLLSTKNVVAITFKDLEPIPAIGTITKKTKHFYLSLEEPDVFVQKLNKRILDISDSDGKQAEE